MDIERGVVMDLVFCLDFECVTKRRARGINQVHTNALPVATRNFEAAVSSGSYQTDRLGRFHLLMLRQGTVKSQRASERTIFESRVAAGDLHPKACVFRIKKPPPTKEGGLIRPMSSCSAMSADLVR